jgi:uncharacterized protein (TIGR00266 family)
MEFETIGGDSYPVLEVGLQPGEEFVAEAGAMSWMDSHIQCRTEARGGVMASLKRKLLTGESLMQNTYSVESEPGTIGLVAGSPGTIIQHEMSGDLYLEKGAFLASTTGVTLDSKFEGLKGLFNEGFFVLKATGDGTLFFTGYGDVRTVDVDGEYVVDNGYAVAWEPSLTYRLSRAKKIRSFLFSDQLLLRFSGQGRIWVQSRSAQSLANFFHPYRGVKSKN